MTHEDDENQPPRGVTWVSLSGGTIRVMTWVSLSGGFIDVILDFGSNRLEFSLMPLSAMELADELRRTVSVSRPPMPETSK